MSVAASVAQSKERNPERYCPVKRCLWRTGGGYCPRHKPAEDRLDRAERLLRDTLEPLGMEFSPSEAQAVKAAIEREDENGK